MHIENVLVRNAHARTLLEYFVVAAVVTIFGIRLFLHLTGYPQLGGASFHIAHMLWGGLLMAVAVFVMLAFLNREARTFGSLVGGVGFGTFIDELGKFITQDNDYFFQPTVLIIYLIFVGLFFLAKQIEIWFPLDKREYLINSLELIKDVALLDLDAAEKKEALLYLRHATKDHELTSVLIKTLNKVEPLPLQPEGVITKLSRRMRLVYVSLINNRFFGKVMIFSFTLASLDNFLLLLMPSFQFATFTEWGLAISTLISLLFVFQGAYYFKRARRLEAFESFKVATLVSIFLVQLFLFYVEQMSAAVELFWAIVSLQILQILIDQENELQLRKSPAHPPTLQQQTV